MIQPSPEIDPLDQPWEPGLTWDRGRPLSGRMVPSSRITAATDLEGEPGRSRGLRRADAWWGEVVWVLIATPLFDRGALVDPGTD
jgi:hypothetical protein